MRLLVCGSRDWTNRDYLFGVLDGIHASQEVSVVIEGEQRGADSMAREWAKGRGIKVLPFPAEWDKHRPVDPSRKNPAGAIRNKAMLEHGRPELVVAFWQDNSPGTRNMVLIAALASVEVLVFTGPKASAEGGPEPSRLPRMEEVRG